MEKPLMLGLLRDRQARHRLQQLDCELRATSSRTRLLTMDVPRTPYAVIIQASPDETNHAREILVAVGRKWPLADALVWAPLAGGNTVRAWFQAGARDVLISRTATALVDAVGQRLPHRRSSPPARDVTTPRGTATRFESMFSCSRVMWDLFELCDRIASTEATVLIVGETGTGKELLAHAVHRRSGRHGRFVTANCASIPPDLINSELFGHEKGAFTGADRCKKGLVMHAHNGTLFLDEIGDMPAEAQQSLLRMLQERSIRPVGSLSESRVDVRIVAATNVLLDQAVAAGMFREDLFYRLDVIRMNIPALRERPEDILFLFGHFTRRLAKQYGLNLPTFTDGFLDAASAYSWPGNVRQLQNFSERLILSRPRWALTDRDFDKLRNTRLAADQPRRKPTNATPPRDRFDVSQSLQANLAPLIEQLEREYLRAVLQGNGGRVAESAAQAGISRRTLLRKMNLYQLDKQEFKG